MKSKRKRAERKKAPVFSSTWVEHVPVLVKVRERSRAFMGLEQMFALN